MKQILIFLLLFTINSSLSAAPSMYFKNTSSCNVYIIIQGSNGVTCGDFTSAVITIPSGTSSAVQYDMFPGGSGTTISWAMGTPSGSGTFNELKFHDYDPTAHCSYGSGSSGSCGVDDMNVIGDGTCASSASVCFDVSLISAGSCASCLAYSTVTATWTSLGSGSYEVDFN